MRSFHARAKAVCAAAIAAMAVASSGCTTMNEDQCLAGDWGGQGYRDGAAGRPLGRLDDHAEACARFGVTPLEAPYRSARDDGLLVYCTRERGFTEGRSGSTYHDVCPVDLERDFLPAYEDGRVVHAAEDAVESAASAVQSHVARLDDLDDKIDAKQRECRDDDLGEAERERACERIGELRDEVRQNRQGLRDARDRLEWAERDLSSVRFRLARVYGFW